MSSSRIVVAALSLAALALIAAGCGGSSSGPSNSGASTAGSSTAATGGEGSGRAMTVSAVESPQLGMLLVDAEGFTVYRFAGDRGTTPACYGACAKAWPPVIAKGRPTAGEGDVLPAGHGQAQGRHAAGHLRGPSPLRLRRRSQSGRSQRQRLDRLRRRMERARRERRSDPGVGRRGRIEHVDEGGESGGYGY
jgi:Secreted repeat of unknown function